jgi:hypothetical protein
MGAVMDKFLGAVGVGFIGLCVLYVVIPLTLQIIDAILGLILRTPFRILAHRWRARAQQSPYQRGLRRATEGTWLLAASVYAATWFPVFLGQSLGDLAQGLARAPADYPGAAVFFIAATLGLLWTVTGVRVARRGGDRDWMASWWSAVIAGICLGLLWWHWFPSPDWRFTTLLEIAGLKTFYIATAAAGLVRLWLTMPALGGGNALRRILRHIESRARRLRPARPRSF